MNLTSCYAKKPEISIRYSKAKVHYSSISKTASRFRIDNIREKININAKPLETITFSNFVKEISKDTSFDMICCPSGTFMTMKRNSVFQKFPLEPVNVRQFLLGKTEVTHRLYTSVMGYHGSTPSDLSNRYPVVNVTWIDAVEFCNRLSVLLGFNPCYTIDIQKEGTTNPVNVIIDDRANGFRLPYIKEWEYAAKAGTNNRWSGCDDEKELAEFAWFGNNNSNIELQPVACKRPNEWGFYDMTGNVEEWCWDLFYGTRKDGTISTERTAMGGHFYNQDPEDLKIEYRLKLEPTTRKKTLGFRIAKSLEC